MVRTEAPMCCRMLSKVWLHRISSIEKMGLVSSMATFTIKQETLSREKTQHLIFRSHSLSSTQKCYESTSSFTFQKLLGYDIPSPATQRQNFPCTEQTKQNVSPPQEIPHSTYLMDSVCCWQLRRWVVAALQLNSQLLEVWIVYSIQRTVQVTNKHIKKANQFPLDIMISKDFSAKCIANC